MKCAIQLRTNGSVLDYSDSLEEIQQIMASSSHNLEIVDTTTASVIKVTYTELGGPIALINAALLTHQRKDIFVHTLLRQQMP